MGRFQDTSGVNGALDGEALFSAVSVSCRRVLTPADIVTALPRALSAATRIGGPAVLLLPKDIQQGLVHAVADDAGEDTRNSVGAATESHVGDPDPLVSLLRRADGTVLIIAGEQVARDDARAELEQLRAVLQAQAGHGSGSEGCRRGPRIVGVGRDRGDGSSRGEPKRGRERAVPIGRALGCR